MLALEDRADETRWMAALSRARLLVPIVAVLAEADEHGGDKAADMVVVTLTAPDGERALPVFTSLQALSAWNSQARPSPVESARAAQAAVAEQCDVMVLDIGGAQVVLRPSMVWALAQQREWLPSYADPFVRESVSRAARDEDDVIAAVCEDGGSGALRVVLELRAGLSSAEVGQVAQAIGERLATDGETRARIDAITFAIRPA